MYKYNRNSFAFHKMDKNVAYWLGLLYTDGCIIKNQSRSIIQLKLKDYELLEQFKDFTQYEGIIETVIEHKDKDFIEYQVRINDRDMVDKLIELGCTPRKTYTLTFPNNIPDEFYHYFILGAFDGDGCVFDKKDHGKIGIDITGCETFLEGMLKELKNKSIIKSNNTLSIAHSKSDKIMRIKIDGILQTEKLYHYFYDDCPDYYLKRKKDKYEMLLKKYNANVNDKN